MTPSRGANANQVTGSGEAKTVSLEGQNSGLHPASGTERGQGHRAHGTTCNFKGSDEALVSDVSDREGWGAARSPPTGAGRSRFVGEAEPGAGLRTDRTGTGGIVKISTDDPVAGALTVSQTALCLSLASTLPSLSYR